MESLLSFDYTKGQFKSNHRQEFIRFLILKGIIKNNPEERYQALKFMEESKFMKNREAELKKLYPQVNIKSVSKFLDPNYDNSIPREAQIEEIADKIINFVYNSQLDCEKPDAVMKMIMEHYLGSSEIKQVDRNKVILALKAGYQDYGCVTLDFLIERSKSFRPMDFATVNWIESLKKIQSLMKKIA